MLESFFKAIQTDSVPLVLGVVSAVQFGVMMYIGKYVLTKTVHKDYFYEATNQNKQLIEKLDEIKSTVENTNTRMQEHNRHNT